MPNQEYYNIKNNSALNLTVFLLIVIGGVAAGIIFLPQVVAHYFSYNISQIAISDPVVLPQAPNAALYKEQLDSLQMPQGVPLSAPDNIFNKPNPFAPL